MKTLGRMLIILLVFTAFSALMIVGVNASGMSSSSFPGEGREFRPGGDGQGFPPPDFQSGADGTGFRPERHGERGGEGGGGAVGLLFGAVKNTLVIALLVVAIVLPKSIARKKRRNGALTSTPSE